MNWWDEDSNKEISVPEFDQFLKDVFSQREKINLIQADLKEEQAKLDKMNSKVLAILKDLKRDSYKSPLGSVSIQRRSSVVMPKDPDSRSKFFDYLKETNQYDTLITVNSQTLNAWYKQEKEAAELEKRSLDFNIPGLGQPSTFETVRLTKGK